MRFEIYNPSAPPKPEPVRLALIQRDSEVAVVAVDKDGKRVDSGNLITFFPDGKIYRHEAVNSTLGFSLEGYGRIALRGE